MKQLFLKKSHIWIFALLSGLLMGISWPVNGFMPVIFISWIPLFFIDQHIRQNPERYSNTAILLYSFITFLIFNLYTTWWVSYSTSAGAILAFTLNSLFMAITFSISHLIDKKLFKKTGSIFTLIFFWTSFEYLHMNWELSWSWLNLGNVFSENPNWVQWYEYTGVLGGSIWVLLINFLIFKIINTAIENKKISGILINNTVLLLIFFLAPIIISFQIKNNTNNNAKETVNTLIIQPNIEPYNEAYALSSSALINNILNIVRENIDDNTELILTPESSIERSMWESQISYYPAIDSVLTFLEKKPQLSFLMGASTRRLLNDNEPILGYSRQLSNDSTKYYYRYNSAMFIKKNKPIEFYHKAKLVPGVERMPFAALLKPIEKLAFDLGGTTGSLGVSTEPKLFKVKENSMVAPIICYESIYGEFVGKFSSKTPSFIGIITNDAWWYDSPGYRQHFSYARLRAIENRKAIARSANTGISGVINAKGEILHATKFYDRTAIKAAIPLHSKLTYYAKNGDYLGRLSLFIISLLTIIAISKQLSSKRKSH